MDIIAKRTAFCKVKKRKLRQKALFHAGSGKEKDRRKNFPPVLLHENVKLFAFGKAYTRDMTVS